MIFRNTSIGKDLDEKGFVIVEDVYTTSELGAIRQLLKKPDGVNEKFRGEKELFAIRNVMQEIPELGEHLRNKKMKRIISDLSQGLPLCIKSIYFDKPEGLNWFVPWHQDMTINVKEKKELNGYGPWTYKHGIHSVQPPVNVLENIFTLRIHLDDADETNGALRVIPGTHKKGILSREQLKKLTSQEENVLCSIRAGSVMVMQPLLLHSSSRSISARSRRVLHLEFTNLSLENLCWQEASHI